MGEMPWVDTIDIKRLVNRVDEGVLHYQAKTMKARVELTRTVSDPATWKLIEFSDEETVGEGDNGRAAMILDGNNSTYYHNKWKNGSIGYPHTFTFYPWMENLDDPVFMTSLRNSFINAFLTMGITLLLGVPAAYGMGRYKVKGISLFLLTFLIQQVLGL